ncbi:MAG: phosphatidate cytidylyltransferase [Ruminococcus sp.]|nr:phosphatidate cytidylyltransferase [Ruminococcus sp.]
MDSMKPRLLTAAIGVPAGILVLILGEFFHGLLFIVIGAFCSIMVMEYLAARQLHKNLMVFIPCMLYAFVQPTLSHFKLSMFTPYVFVLVMFIIMIFFHEQITYSEASFAIFGTLVIVFGMTSMLIVPGSLHGYYVLFFVITLAIPWIADGGAYFAGVFLGKHKLCPKISPKKTIEGFIGGIAAGILSSLIIALIFNATSQTAKLNIALMLLLGALVSVVSVIGDLSFSLVKRSCDIKDFGSFFPGHGGVLDRFDSVIFTAPIIYFMVKFLPVFVV